LDKVLADRKKYDKSAEDIQKSFQDNAKAQGAGSRDFDF
jgi:hypothetical protein